MFKRSVKQGDPIPLLLFNCAIDILISELAKADHGILFKGTTGRMTILGYADDLISLSHSVSGMQCLIDSVLRFCEHYGMALNPSKCLGMMLHHARDHVTVNTDVNWKINGKEIPLILPEETFKYLGVTYSHVGRLIELDLVGKLREWIMKIGTHDIRLKPDQRVVRLLTGHAVSRLNHVMTTIPTNGVFLSKLDKIIRAAVGDWLKLPQCTANGLLYSSSEKSELAVPRLAMISASAKIKTSQKLSRSTHFVVPDIAPRHSDDPLVPEVDGRERWRNREYESWTQLPVQRKGVKHFCRSPDNNSWLVRPEGRKSSL